MKNNRVKMITASALVLALTLSAGVWRNDDSVYANGGAPLSSSADPDARGNAAGHNKKERASAQGSFRLFADERIAAVLGLTADQLSSGFKAGRSLAELANERGADVTAVKLVIKAALKEKLDAKLSAGELTQEQYNKQADRLADFAAVLLGSKHGGGRTP